ncbi:MAG: ParB/RepB/Spo0J family partition protein [Actinobacteria bacterium]|nr:ParB/RepB/Spo0J family partition protein [Actinomycetota bacterium]
MVKRRSGLGRGLDALLPPEQTLQDEGSASQAQAPIAAIDPNPRQPRTTFEDDALAELAESITQLGVLQPLLVRQLADGRFELIAGERRLRAAARAGLESVPVMVVETDDRGSLERAGVENIHRRDLNPLEEAAAYRALIEEGGLTQEDLAQRVGKSRAAITNALRLLELPTALQRMLVERRLTSGHARALMGLDKSPFQERLGRRVAEEGLSVRDTEDLVRRYQAMSTNSDASPERAPLPPLASDARRRLEDHLQTRVRVEVGKKRGKIVVDFTTIDDLERLLATLLGDDPGSTTVVSLD